MENYGLLLWDEALKVKIFGAFRIIMRKRSYQNCLFFGDFSNTAIHGINIFSKCQELELD